MRTNSSVEKLNMLDSEDTTIQHTINHKVHRINAMDKSLTNLRYLSGNKDDVREESGRHPIRTDIPISIDPTCLSHLKPGQETNLVLKLFKVACLAYKPSCINFRN